MWFNSYKQNHLESKSRADNTRLESERAAQYARDLEATKKPSLWSRFKGLFKKKN